MTHPRLSSLIVVTSASEDPISRLEAKTWLRIEEEETAEDELIDQLIAMASQRYEEYTRRVPIQTTYDLYLDDWPDGALSLPRWPLVSITSVRGLTDTDATDTGGTSMSSSEYYVDVASEPGRLVPLANDTYPTATRVANAAIVQFTAGHTTDQALVPEHIKVDLRKMIAHAYEHRGDQGLREIEALMDEALTGELEVQEWG